MEQRWCSRVFVFSLWWTNIHSPTEEISRQRAKEKPDVDGSVELFIWNVLNISFCVRLHSQIWASEFALSSVLQLRGTPSLQQPEYFWVKSKIGRQNRHYSYHWSSPRALQYSAWGQDWSCQHHDEWQIYCECVGGVGHLYSLKASPSSPRGLVLCLSRVPFQPEETAICFTQIDNPGVVGIIACSCSIREGSENVENWSSCFLTVGLSIDYVVCEKISIAKSKSVRIPAPLGQTWILFHLPSCTEVSSAEEPDHTRASLVLSFILHWGILELWLWTHRTKQSP